jgi:hypothetical protein
MKHFPYSLVSTNEIRVLAVAHHYLDYLNSLRTGFQEMASDLGRLLNRALYASGALKMESLTLMPYVIVSTRTSCASRPFS